MHSAIIFHFVCAKLCNVQYVFAKKLKRLPPVMAIGVVEFSREGYKIRKDFA